MLGFNYSDRNKELVEHIPNHLEYAAYNCYQAACYRNILPEEELKTLIFQTEKKQIFAVHLPGDRQVDLQKLPNENMRIKLLDLSNYKIKGLQKGTVNPFNIVEVLLLKKVFICQSIFDYKKIYTNDGTVFGTLSFAPEVLLQINKISYTGNFSSK